MKTATAIKTDRPIVMGNPVRFDAIKHAGDRQRQIAGLAKLPVTFDDKLADEPITLFLWTWTGKNFEDKLEELSITPDDLYVYPLGDIWSVRHPGKDALLLDQLFGSRINALKYKIDEIEYARSRGPVSAAEYDKVSPEYMEWLLKEWEAERAAYAGVDPQPAVGAHPRQWY